MKVYAGKIEELRLGKYDDKKTGEKESILNIVVSTTQTLVGTIEIATQHTVVLFKKMADNALDKLKEGQYVIFNNVDRNPRVYEVPVTGTIVETVEVNVLPGGGFKKLSRKHYMDNKVELEPYMLTDLDFTDEDRESFSNHIDPNSGLDEDMV